MPDISMCTDMNCPVRQNCYRFMATPNPDRQSYVLVKSNGYEPCDIYWPMSKTFVNPVKPPNCT